MADRDVARMAEIGFLGMIGAQREQAAPGAILTVSYVARDRRGQPRVRSRAADS